MIIVVGNVWARIPTCTDEELEWAQAYLTFEEAAWIRTRRRAKRTMRRYRLLEPKHGRFPAGLAGIVAAGAKRHGFEATTTVVANNQVKPLPVGDATWLRDYQAEAVEACLRHHRGLVKMPTGCHRVGQELLMYDGGVRRVETIRIGDKLMGPDGTPRRVSTLHSGIGDMARIQPCHGDPFVVNLDHVLTLVKIQSSNHRGSIVDVAVREWLLWPPSLKRMYQLWKQDGRRRRYSGFYVELLLLAERYYGFELNHDGRYLLADFTVTHNSGKTECAAALIHLIQVPWLYLAHRSNLVHQTAARFEARTGEVCGVVDADRFEPRRVTAASFQTLYSRIDRPEVGVLLAEAGGVICDEAHVVAAEMMRTVVQRTTAAYWRIGLSATPTDRSDRRTILTVGALGPVIHVQKAEPLIQRGFLARPDITMVRCDQTWDAKGRRRAWASVYRDLVVRSKARNTIIVDEASRCPRPVIVFVDAVEHGKTLAKCLEVAGLRTVYVDGSTSTSARDATIRAAEHGRLDAIVATVVFAEGVDIPSLRSVVIAAGKKSVIRALQRIGRGSRPRPGKTSFVVIDIDDRGDTWLRKHSKKRAAAYRREGYEPRCRES